MISRILSAFVLDEDIYFKALANASFGFILRYTERINFVILIAQGSLLQLFNNTGWGAPHEDTNN